MATTQTPTVEAMSLYEASREARRIKWAGTTRSVGILVSRNGRERTYYFDRQGMVVGRELDGQFIPFDYPWRPKA